MTELSKNLCHRIQFQDTSILSMSSGGMESMIEGTTETQIHADNMNKEEGFSPEEVMKATLCPPFFGSYSYY
jgi:hypothetical protein